MSLYSIRDEQQEIGLLKVSDLMEALSTGVIPFFGKVFCENQNEWISFSKHQIIAPAIVQLLKTPQRGLTEKSILGHWFIRVEDQNFGPFPLIQLIELRQQNNISSESLVRHPKQNHWREFANVAPFDDKSVKALFEFPELKNIFTQRKSPRVQYDNDVCISAFGSLYSGVSLSLSKKGIGIIVPEETNMKVKDKLNLIINPNSEHGTIQSKCEVVSFHRNDGKDKIGLVFDQEIEPLTEYIERRVPLL